jgi:hypothetical protein
VGGNQLVNPRAVLGYADYQDARQVVNCHLHALHDFAWGDSSQVGLEQNVECSLASV